MPCDAWPVTWPTPEAEQGFTEAVAAAAVDAATGQLRAYAGFGYGVCTFTEQYRPLCSSGCWMPYKDTSGQWRNRGGAHSCCRIELAQAPVRAVTEVRLYGAILDASGYALERGVLRRRSACWPCEEDCGDPPVQVTYTAGRLPGASAAVALGELAFEYATGMSGGVCKLPGNAVSVTRQGVTVQLTDPNVSVDLRRLGLPLVDAWLDTVNPYRLRSRSRVYSPDMAQRA